jgi:hypothetical protein
MAISAAFVAMILSGALGVAIFVAGAFITFRWFARNDDERRRKVRLKRGARFGCLCLWLLIFFTGMALAFPPDGLIKPETMADVAMVIAALVPLAFGIGTLTAK